MGKQSERRREKQRKRRAQRRKRADPTLKRAKKELKAIAAWGRFLNFALMGLFAAVVCVAVNVLGGGTTWWPFPIVGITLIVAIDFLRARAKLSRTRRRAEEATPPPHDSAAEDRATDEAAELERDLIEASERAREALERRDPDVARQITVAETQALAVLGWLSSCARIPRGGKLQELRRAWSLQLPRLVGSSRQAVVGGLGDIDRLTELRRSLDERTSEARARVKSLVLALRGVDAAGDEGPLLDMVRAPLVNRLQHLSRPQLAAAPPSSGATAPPGTSAPSTEPPSPPEDEWAQEIELARELQQSLLPQAAPRIAGLEIAQLYRPCNEVGGDFVDFAEVSPSTLLVALGDASGHGLDSCMVSTMAKSALYTNLQADPSLDTTLGRINDLMAHTLGKRRMMTLQLMEIDLDRRELRWVNAGHLFPTLVRAGQAGAIELEELETSPSYPLGIRSGTSYGIERTSIQDGDLIVLMTDGWIEATDADGVELGWASLEATLREIGTQSPRNVLDELAAKLDSHVGSTELTDDVTIVALRIGAAP